MPPRPARSALRAAALVLLLGLPPGCEEAVETEAAAPPPPPRPQDVAGLARLPRPSSPEPTSEAARAVLLAAAELVYRLMPDFEGLAARVMPAVVSIASRPPTPRPCRRRCAARRSTSPCATGPAGRCGRRSGPPARAS